MKTPPLGMTETNFCAIVDPRSPNPKTETRRLSNGSDKPKYNVGDRCYLTEPTQIESDIANSFEAHVSYFWHKPEIIWQPITEEDSAKILNRKSGVTSKQIARFMLKSFARYWVEIVDVKLERLLDITAEAAIAEGIKKSIGYNFATNYYDYVLKEYGHREDPISSYFSEIEMLHGKEIANSNPWVWVYKFKFIGNNNE
jgi:hypothetical protein